MVQRDFEFDLLMHSIDPDLLLLIISSESETEVVKILVIFTDILQLKAINCQPR